MPDTNTSNIVPLNVLTRRLRDINRSAHASMPWGYRIAALLVRLAGDSLDAFGRVVSAEMILAAVRGMPDIGGKPAIDWIQDVHRKGADVLPFGTGRPFAAKVFKIVLAKFGDPEVAEEAMSHLMLQAARDKLHIANGSDLHSAESYLITSCLNAARDVLRGKQRRREVPLVRERDDDREIDIADPETFRDLDKSISPTDMDRILDAVEEVHPRARDYLESVLRGDSQAEWARELGVTDAAISKFVRKIRPTLQQALREHLRSAAMGVRRLAYNYRR